MNRRPRTRVLRALAAGLLASVMLVTAGCEPPTDDRAIIVLHATCGMILYGFGFDEDVFEEIPTCAKNLFGLGATSSPARFQSARHPAAAGVTQTGEMLTFAYAAEGSLSAEEFPELSLPVPYQALATAGAETVDVLVRTMLLDSELVPAAELFGSMQVTLRSVDDSGGETLLGEATVNISSDEVGGSVIFEDIASVEGLETVVGFSGGAVEDAVFLLTTGVTLPSVETTSAISDQLRAASTPSDQAIPPLSEAERSVWLAPGVQNLLTGPGAVFAFYRAQGAVRAKRFPKMVLNLPPPEAGSGKVDVDVGLNVLTENFKSPKKKLRPKSVTATLFTVNDGKTKKAGQAKSKVEKSGAAALRFEQIKVPPNGHLRVVLRMKGKKVKNALVLAFGSADAPTG